MTDPQTFPIEEKATGRYTATIVGNDGVTPLPGATLTTLILSLYVIKQDGTDGMIRTTQNVLGANNVTVDAAGLLVWLVQVADTTLIEAIPYERHIALFEWTWPTGSGKHEVVLLVRNLRRVT